MYVCIYIYIQVVVSNMFYFHPSLGKIPILTSIFQLGWNRQLDMYDDDDTDYDDIVVIALLDRIYIFLPIGSMGRTVYLPTWKP